MKLVTYEYAGRAAIGLLEPGKLIAIQDLDATWRGLVRSTRISAGWVDTVHVRQAVEIERHFL